LLAYQFYGRFIGFGLLVEKNGGGEYWVLQVEVSGMMNGIAFLCRFGANGYADYAGANRTGDD
jgi:hypothetical protein